MMPLVDPFAPSKNKSKATSLGPKDLEWHFSFNIAGFRGEEQMTPDWIRCLWKKGLSQTPSSEHGVSLRAVSFVRAIAEFRPRSMDADHRG